MPALLQAHANLLANKGKDVAAYATIDQREAVHIPQTMNGRALLGCLWSLMCEHEGKSIHFAFVAANDSNLTVLYMDFTAGYVAEAPIHRDGGHISLARGL